MVPPSAQRSVPTTRRPPSSDRPSQRHRARTRGNGVHGSDRHARPTTARAWSEDSIRSALTTFLSGRTTWPTYEEFVTGGAKGLRDALGRIHGPEWWAAEMGVTGGDRRRGGVRRWGDATIRAALAEFLGDRSDWPTHREFQRTGHAGLYEAVRCRGGSRRWAAEMGVATPHSMRGRPVPYWTGQRIARELASFLDGRTEWPRHRDFVAAGQGRLYRAVARRGGPAMWAKQMGVRYIRRRGGPPTYWTETRVRQRLSALLSGRDRWPTRAEFAAAGEQRLLAAINRRRETKRWRAEFKVGPPRRGASGRARSREWTETAITGAIAPLIQDLRRWPTKEEFRAAGLLPALSAVYRYGGSAHWQRRFGVAAREIPDRTRWTEQSIDRALREICRGRTEWPEPREFKAMGAMPLYHAASRHGGIYRWRARFGLEG
jgi:hypothetical protein